MLLAMARGELGLRLQQQLLRLVVVADSQVDLGQVADARGLHDRHFQRVIQLLADGHGLAQIGESLKPVGHRPR